MGRVVKQRLHPQTRTAALSRHKPRRDHLRPRAAMQPEPPSLFPAPASPSDQPLAPAAGLWPLLPSPGARPRPSGRTKVKPQRRRLALGLGALAAAATALSLWFLLPQRYSASVLLHMTWPARSVVVA